jgi:hypothetical protein
MTYIAAAIANKPAAEVTDDEARFVASLATAKHGEVAAEFAGRDNMGRAVIRIQFPADEAHLDGEYSVGRVLGQSLRPAPVKKVSKKAAARANRIIVAVVDLPPIGVPVDIRGKRVVVESFGKSWILDSDTADSIWGLLDLDGRLLRILPVKAATDASIPRSRA